MSGGHWDYVGPRIEESLVTIGQDARAQEHWPATCALLLALGPLISQAEHDMDWHLSSDTAYSPRDLELVAAVLDAALKAAPDAWFPKGKWATIQAVQERAEKRQ